MQDKLTTNDAVTTTTTSKRKLDKKRILILAVAIVLVVLVAVMLIVSYYYGWLDRLTYNRNTYSVKAIANEQLSIHFMQLRNGSNGDSVYIKAGDTDILVDAGSENGSARTIGNYIDQFCTDGILEYVIVTHADVDHIAGFVGKPSVKGIFDRYECETIIQFARTDKTSQTYYDYCAKRDAEVATGANCYTALECYNNANGAKRQYVLSEGITLTILYQEYYEKQSVKENNYSVCFMITQEYVVDGSTQQNNYLFTGDLEKDGEISLVNCNPDLPEMTLYKGAHHGSRTSSQQVLLEVIKPQIVCICCNAGGVSNSQHMPYTFPTQAFVDRIAPYTDEVYVTDIAAVKLNKKTGTYQNVGHNALNGDIVIACTNGNITKYFSRSDIKLKDTDWFKENRSCPDAWV